MTMEINQDKPKAFDQKSCDDSNCTSIIFVINTFKSDNIWLKWLN